MDQLWGEWVCVYTTHIHIRVQVTDVFSLNFVALSFIFAEIAVCVLCEHVMASFPEKSREKVFRHRELLALAPSSGFRQTKPHGKKCRKIQSWRALLQMKIDGSRELSYSERGKGMAWHHQKQKITLKTAATTATTAAVAALRLQMCNSRLNQLFHALWRNKAISKVKSAVS